MEIKNLYTFKAIIEEGSFSNAANKLGYTQSTITFQMKQLEAELDMKLFEKIGRRMLLTKTGEAILPYVNETINAYEKMQNAGKELSKVKGELSIIISETLLCYCMKDVIREFHEVAPGVQLKLRTLDCHSTRQQLIDGNADIGICYDEEENDDRLNIFSLGPCHMCLVGSSGLVERLGLKQLDFAKSNTTIPVSLITDEPSGIFRRKFERYVLSNKITMDNTIELWSTETIKSMIASDLGVGYLPAFVVQNEVRNGTFIALNHKIPNENFRCIYACHKNKHISPQMQYFMDLLEKYLRIDEI